MSSIYYQHSESLQPRDHIKKYLEMREKLLRNENVNGSLCPGIHMHCSAYIRTAAYILSRFA